MTVRLLTNRDYAGYLRLINDFRETQFTENEFIERLLDLSRHGIEIYVMEDTESGELVATATLIVEPKFIFNLATYAHIEDVCVSAARRREGLGKQIMKELLAICKQRGYYKVSLCCADHNVAFYEACGLEKRGNQMCQLVSLL
jgi:glucosamine-phosphate N-acetyltransferase